MEEQNSTVGQACFVCVSDENMQELDTDGSRVCPNCFPVVALDAMNGQQSLAHVGAHVLHDPKVDRCSNPCGFCLCPSPTCQIFLKKGKGAKASLKINTILSNGCPNMVEFSYSVAEKSSKSSPCSNVPVQCPLCSKSDPAIWRYNMYQHIIAAHPSAQPSSYQSIWFISNFEKVEMKRIWTERHKVIAKRPKKPRVPLVTSQAHTSRVALR